MQKFSRILFRLIRIRTAPTKVNTVRVTHPLFFIKCHLLGDIELKNVALLTEARAGILHLTLSLHRSMRWNVMVVMVWGERDGGKGRVCISSMSSPIKTHSKFLSLKNVTRLDRKCAFNPKPYH